MAVDIARLADHWRSQVKATRPREAQVLQRCADELEQSWHDHAHDGAWETDGSCRVCDAERKTEGADP